VTSASDAGPLATFYNTFAQREFDFMPTTIQRCVDEAVNLLEWDPLPEDATDLGDENWAVFRCGVWILYSYDLSKRELDLWRFVRAW
jgi:hypothetical protein